MLACVQVASKDPSARFDQPAAGPEPSGLKGWVKGEQLDVNLSPVGAWALLVVDR